MHARTHAHSTPSAPHLLGKLDVAQVDVVELTVLELELRAQSFHFVAQQLVLAVGRAHLRLTLLHRRHHLRLLGGRVIAQPLDHPTRLVLYEREALGQGVYTGGA